MNQIEWCQVRLDITQEIQVTRRSKLPGDPEIPGDLAGKFTRRSGAGKFTRRCSTGKFDPALGNLIVLKPSTHRHNCFAEN